MNDSKKLKSVWPYGTLVELYLLAPHENKDSARKQILENIKLLVGNAKARAKTEAITSTEFQLSRYIEWWNSTDFKIPELVLAKDLGFLKLVLKELNT